ncbi:MAG: TIGR01777 family protein [Proteobacteria bacterium]|nr:MAG: TIGR01777 family protein [Pseudomonadota bacterium]PIE67316.1 MAG: TIGR01777 family protein [Deltaproteobacteria bacterium]
MNIVVAGASGFVGSALARSLLVEGHRVTGLGTSARHPMESESGFNWISADTIRGGAWQEAVRDADAVVNLTGRTIFKRWTRRYKKVLLDSRVLTTRNIVEAMRRGGQVLVSASAIGYYGDRGDEALDEMVPPGDDFLADLSVGWEHAALSAQNQGVRVAVMRFGVVLGNGGGALAQMLPVFRRFAGGPLGSGSQWFSWIHMTDLLNIVHYLLEDKAAVGVYNAVAPGTIRHKAFVRCLAKELNRPAVVWTPAPALRLMLGEMAGVLLGSQKVHPKRLMDAGFEFRFSDAASALKDLVN